MFILLQKNRLLKSKVKFICHKLGGSELIRGFKVQRNEIEK